MNRRVRGGKSCPSLATERGVVGGYSGSWGISRSTRYIIPKNGIEAAAETPAQSHSAATSSRITAPSERPIPRMAITRSTTAVTGIGGCWIVTTVRAYHPLRHRPLDGGWLSATGRRVRRVPSPRCCFRCSALTPISCGSEERSPWADSSRRDLLRTERSVASVAMLGVGELVRRLRADVRRDWKHPRPPSLPL